MNDLSTINEKESMMNLADVAKIKFDDSTHASSSGDSGLASANESLVNDKTDDAERGKDILRNKCPDIIKFKALNEIVVPKESTFLGKAKERSNPCDISSINGGPSRKTLDSDGKY